jgi:O-antigen ligase
VLIFGITVAASLLLAVIDDRVFVLGRLEGVTMHPNVLALVAAVFAILPEDSEGRAPRLRRLLRLAAGGATVILTQSLLGFAILVIWVLAQAGGWVLGRLTAVHAQQATRLLLVSAVCVFLITPFITTQVDLNDVLRLVADDPSQVIRVKLWHSAWLTLLDNPVLGSGFGSLDLVTDHEFAYSHSVVMDYLRSTGILGGMAMLLLLYQVIRATFALPMEDTGLVAPNIPVALPIAFAIIMFSSAEAGLQQLPLSWVMLWFAVGFGVWTTKPSVEKVGGLAAAKIVAAHHAPEPT